MPHLTLLHYCLFFITGLVAGTVDAIAGGGGLIVLPVLLGTGIPAPLVLGTNKLGASFGTGSATWSFAHRGAVRVNDCWPGIIATLVGAAGGATCVQLLDSRILAEAIPWLLIAIVVYMIFRPNLGEQSRQSRLRPGPFYLLFGLVLGFYDGFFGPGVGSFWMIAFVAVLGLDFVRAAAHARLMNFVSNAAALTVFALKGSVLVVPGLMLGAGQLVGGQLGANLAVTRGARFVRPIFLVMAGLTVLKLLYQLHFHP